MFSRKNRSISSVVFMFASTFIVLVASSSVLWAEIEESERRPVNSAGPAVLGGIGFQSFRETNAAGGSVNNDFFIIDFGADFSLGDFGIGVRIRLPIDAAGEVRDDSFDKLDDFVSIIRYVRYGRKGDRVHIRAGSLDNARLGC